MAKLYQGISAASDSCPRMSSYLHHFNRIFATRRWAPAVRLEISSCCDPATEIALVWCLVADLVIIRVPLAASGFEFYGFPSMSIGPHCTQRWERSSSRTMKYILSPRCERSSSVGKGPVALHRHSHGIFSLGDHWRRTALHQSSAGGADAVSLSLHLRRAKTFHSPRLPTVHWEHRQASTDTCAWREGLVSEVS